MTTRRQAERAIEAHADELSAYPNVVGVGMGETAGDRSKEPSSPCVAVYVTEKKPSTELAPSELLPGFVEIRERGDTVKVRVEVIEMGRVDPETDLGRQVENRSNDGDDGSTFFPQ